MDFGKYKQVGVVKDLARFPVKSMGGEDIAASYVGWHGFDGDRRFTYVKTSDKSGFPWFTIRDYPGLVQYKAYFENPDDVRESPVRVKTPTGLDFAIDDSELAEVLRAVSGKDVRLLQNWSGVYDTMDISVISIESMKAIESATGEKLDPRRFRSNIVIEMHPWVERDFPEEKLVGMLLKFGDREDSAKIRVHRKDARCMVVNVSPETGKQNPGILKEIVAGRKNNLGVYGSTERPGTVRVGDPILTSD